MYLSVCSFFEKYVLTVQCVYNAWKRTYIIVIGNCHSKMSLLWQYLISSQVLYICALNTDFLFENRHWHAVDLNKRNLLSYIWSMLDTLKDLLSRDKCPVHDRNFVGQCDNSVLTHNGIFGTISYILSLFRNTWEVKNAPCTHSETFKEDSDALQRYKIIKSRK